MGFTLFHTDMLPGVPEKLVFEPDGATVGEVLQWLADRYGVAALHDVLDHDGILHEEAMVVLNGGILHREDALAVVVPAGSELMITVKIAGG